MKQSESIAKLAAALVAVQSELRGVAKDSTNPDFRSSYTSLDAIIEKSRPVLAKNGLAIVQGATTPHTDEKSRIAAIAVETMLVHESGEWLTNTAIMPVVGRMLKGGGRADVDPQAGGSALSYGRRYGIAALLCLATEDDDGNAASQRSGGKGTGGGQTVPRQERSTSDIGHHTPRNTSGTTQACPLPGADYLMPIGKNRGKRVGDLDTETLSGVAEWVNEKQFQKKHADLLIAIASVLKSREAA